ncbi:MAG: pilus assembly protein N-terminal domain-containing protein [Proteobacteria bacterium]|nr:pilus assembly protein N-terminal domain-containing protein [Pseudomonadota bacterium]MCH8976052.1 pilus assembly protein N-terminal domain-containing protein [Pseudomonadota bacterium]
MKIQKKMDLTKMTDIRMDNRVQTFNIKNFFLAFLLILMATSAFATDNISMFLGEIKIIEVGAIDRVAVGKGDLLSTTMLDNGQLLLLAEKNGETTVHIWYSDGSESDIKVQILVSDQDRLVHELQTLLADLPGVEVKVVGQKIFLTGYLNCIAGQEDCEESKTIKTVQGVYKDVINLTRVRAQAAPIIMPSSKMVSMSVKITEFNTNKLSKLGINWSDVISGPFAGFGHNVVGNSVFGATSIIDGTNLAAELPLNINPVLGTFGLATGIASAINLLISTGDAILLAEPRLSARSGGKAEFLAGGEIPVVTSSISGTDVEYKEFGIILNISPIVDDENNIMATINTEVSAVDFSNAVGDVPAFITRKTTTDVFMKDGETLVLSGLIDRSLGESIDKFPILGDIPILGALFRSTDWNNDLTELVIFVTPTVFDAKSQFNQERIQRRDDLIQLFKEKVDRDDVIID